MRMTTKIGIGVLSASILAGTVSVRASNDFQDVRPGHPHYVDINIARSNGWIKGYYDNNFYPDATIRPEQIEKIVRRALGDSPTRGDVASFMVGGMNHLNSKGFTPTPTTTTTTTPPENERDKCQRVYRESGTISRDCRKLGVTPTTTTTTTTTTVPPTTTSTTTTTTLHDTRRVYTTPSNVRCVMPNEDNSAAVFIVWDAPPEGSVPYGVFRRVNYRSKHKTDFVESASSAYSLGRRHGVNQWAHRIAIPARVGSYSFRIQYEGDYDVLSRHLPKSSWSSWVHVQYDDPRDNRGDGNHCTLDNHVIVPPTTTTTTTTTTIPPEQLRPTTPTGIECRMTHRGNDSSYVIISWDIPPDGIHVNGVRTGIKWARISRVDQEYGTYTSGRRGTTFQRTAGNLPNNGRWEVLVYVYQDSPITTIMVSHYGYPYPARPFGPWPNNYTPSIWIRTQYDGPGDGFGDDDHCTVEPY